MPCSRSSALREVSGCIAKFVGSRTVTVFSYPFALVIPMAKYGSQAQSEVKHAMHEKKQGKLKSGKSGKTVKSKKQAIAIGLSKARKKGAKVPRKKKS
jgi:hypothetical protein